MTRTEPAHPLDAFYTPDWLADQLAACLPDGFAGSVLDPAAGAGSLLAAVERRFGQRVRLLGLDVDERAVRSLQVAQPGWTVSHADMLSPASRSASRAWRAAKDGVAAVVLNPPFSYRGNGGPITTYGDFTGRVAPAMRFLVEVLRSLRPTQGVFAILPDGALDAEKHVALWAQIAREFTVRRVRRVDSTSFRGATVSTSLVELAPGSTSLVPLVQVPAESPRLEGCRCVEVIRGRVQVHQLSKIGADEPAPFIHTTTLANLSGRWLAPARLADDAPLILVTRVGHWSDPIVLDVGRAVLSDCLIALRPRARLQVEALRESVAGSSAVFQASYRGTGAKYLTLDSTVRRLLELGWHPHIVKASSPVGSCCCGAARQPACAI